MTASSKAAKKRDRKVVLDEISDLIALPGYIFVIAELSSEDLFVDTRNVANINWRDRLHNNEFALLIGLLLKSKKFDFTELKSEEIKKLVKQTRQLLEELHWTFLGSRTGLKPKKKPQDKKQFQREVFSERDMIVESTFYDNSGFYDMQCFEMAAKLYKNDLEWLKNNTNFNLENAQAICLGIEDIINGLHYMRNHEDELIKAVGKQTIDTHGPLRAIDEMAFSSGLVLKHAQKHNKQLTKKDVKDFFELFSCTIGDQLESFKQPGDENIFTYKPLIKVADDVYFLPNKMFLAAAIYKSPLYWMRQDESYVAIAGKHIGDITEDITYEYFVSIFGEQNVYRDVDVYPGKNRATDIDVMGIIGNTAIIAQNKSKKMTISALSGNIETIKSDFEKAVIEPFQQGIKVRDIILNEQPYRLKDRSGKLITLPEGIERAYILCVSNEPYPAIMHQMRAFLINEGQLPPMQISLFDLDLMALYLKDPYNFAFYIKRRVELDEKIIADTEITLLGLYLKMGLFIPSGATILSPDQSFSQLVDADYYHRKKLTPAPKKSDRLLRDWSNPIYDELLTLVKNLDSPKKTDLVFFLMSLSTHFVDTLTKYIEIIRQKGGDKGYHDFTIPFSGDDGMSRGVTYVIGPQYSGVNLRLKTISSMNKYRSRASEWLSLGASSDGVVQLIALDDSPWEKTQEMDEALDFYTRNTHGKKVDIESEGK